ncbi:hypothetical protein JHD49_09295 [Sulfurimonas sp. SAG-AH-194-C21]|nr:hypothetical protein [Sulfurimonas sp. SAG-AH-194-C21]MDF1884133.1 hypothetical protein [Sulfurimonas sp. SAG-AH-194-C21]
MKVSVHAGERFLERVVNKSTYTCIDVDFAMRYLHHLFLDVVPGSSNKQFVLPGFENFRAVYRENTIITIIPKGRAHV